jgi:hypothetical protein
VGLVVVGLVPVVGLLWADNCSTGNNKLITAIINSVFADAKNLILFIMLNF